jgi:cobalt/nickel transport protein
MKQNCAVIFTALLYFSISLLHGHFQTLIPSHDICEDQAQAAISFDLTFCHPFEGDLMHMAKPLQFGVLVRGEKRIDLLRTLEENKKDGFSTWHTSYTLNMPGDHVFFVEPEPYWEPAEGAFIVHYTKVVVNGFGMEVGWDAEIGLKTEIIPLTRPYGLYTGNLFQGIVFVNGKPAPFTEVEVEYYNDKGMYTAPAGPFVTQVIKTDADGVFSYAMPIAGWWGFAALNEDENTLLNPEDGKQYPVEIGALIWVHVVDME